MTKKKNLSEETSNVILASIKNSSFKQYDVIWKKWWLFCKKKNFDPFSDCIPNILEFLTFLFQQGAAHGSINSARSAIAMLVGSQIAENPEVKRFVKGSSNLKPSTPKYDEIWDPCVVLKFFSRSPENADCDLKTLTLKLVTLLALVTAQRSQTLALIDIRNVQKTDDKFQIKIPQPIKTSGPNRRQPVLLLPKYPINKKVCIFSVLECYLDRTADLRGQENSLFISFKKPHTKVCGQTLSRWIKETLKNSGIDTEIFTAHSTRHASTSAAFREGVSLDVIRKTACWSENSAMFAKVYNLKLTEDRSKFALSFINGSVD